MPIFKLPDLSILIWPLVLLIDVLAVILAVVTMTVGPIQVVLLLTLVATGAWIFRIPEDLTGALHLAVHAGRVRGVLHRSRQPSPAAH